jgi:two-component system, cell cycle sensor histidine kinase and response regulator CckA
MAIPVRLLLVEDSDDDELLLIRAIKNGGIDPNYKRVSSEAELKSQLSENSWDIVISDFNLVGFDGLEALKIVKEKSTELPFILVSGTVGEEVAVKAMKAGAQDYIMKNNTVRLTPAISRELLESDRRKENRRKLAEKEDEIRQVQKLELIGQVAGGLAHDFNNILGIIGLYTEKISMANTGDENIQKCVKGISDAHLRGATLIRQLLTISRKGPTDFRKFDLNAIVRNLREILTVGLGRSNELVIRLSSEPAYINGDPNQIEQILMNLILNARDAMTGGGQVVVQTEIDRCSPPNIVLTVVDSGTGMDQATLRRAFEPFFTTKEPGKGSGMGLATVFAITKVHHGEISVTSELNRGTRFSISIPLAQGR